MNEKQIQEVMALVDRYAHVYAFVGDDTMPRARAAIESALREQVREVPNAQHEIIKIAAECARREPIAAMYELTGATHIGHRQFSRAFNLVEAAMVRLSVRLKDVADSLSAAPTQPAQAEQPSSTNFAALVRNEALEEIARVCDDADKNTHPSDLADAIRSMKEVKT